MTEEQLEKANQLKQNIDELESFVFLAKRKGFWEKIIFKKELKLFTNVHGYDEDSGYRLSKDLSLKVIEVLEKQIAEWRGELDSI